MYFRLNILRLCKNLIRPVESRKLSENGTMGQMVTYRYYKGRLDLFEDQHGEAEMNLDYAFQHCHRNSIKNKRCILKYLVPVKLYRGRLPSHYRAYDHCVACASSATYTHYSSNHLFLVLALSSWQIRTHWISATSRGDKKRRSSDVSRWSRKVPRSFYSVRVFRERMYPDV